jgi:hypothetical protein
MLFIKIMKRVKERPDSANNKTPSPLGFPIFNEIR